MMILSRAVVVFVSLSVQFITTKVLAVPAIVWNKSQQIDDSKYVSNEVPLAQFIQSFETSKTSTNNDLSIMFLLDRDNETGKESLTSITPLLKQIQQQQHVSIPSPQQFLHVSGMESGPMVVHTIKRSATNGEQNTSPVLINLNELSYKLNSTTSTIYQSQNGDDTVQIELDVSTGSITNNKNVLPPTKASVKLSKRNRMIENSNWFVVSVPSNIHPDVLDTTIVQSLLHDNVQTIVLSGIRSVEEVKYEREVQMRRSLLGKTIISNDKTNQKQLNNEDGMHHRRLEEGQGEDNNDDLSGIYYVQMTPNIFSGILFFFMFSTVTLIGISCMNMIAGQDVYVHTMPSIGREA